MTNDPYPSSACSSTIHLPPDDSKSCSPLPGRLLVESRPTSHLFIKRASFCIDKESWGSWEILWSFAASRRLVATSFRGRGQGGPGVAYRWRIRYKLMLGLGLVVGIIAL